tara:strand:+ start:203 stop:898 length:696 start_codon:yes stop_codon:yes gene_type:complete
LIKDKTIIITGTSKGIGYFLAKQFLKTGNTVWGCSRSKNSIKHKKYIHTKLDLNNEKQIINWVKNISKKTNLKIDLLINNAATYEKNLNFFNNESNINSTFKVNLIAPVLLTNLISKIMLKKGEGSIFFISSAASILQEPGTSLYASSKSALEKFAKILRQELVKFNVKVSVLRIQYIKTSLSKKVGKSKLLKLKKYFVTNKLSTKKKLYKEIVKIFSKKTPPFLTSDSLR